MPTYNGNNANNILTGSSGADDIRGFGGDDVLNGNGGNDTMRGGADNDTYITDGGDLLIELAGQGIDLVRSSVSWTLGDHFENLALTGSAHLNGTGNALNNVITGNAGNNVLDGGAGIDTFQIARENGSWFLTSANLGSGIATGHGTDTLLNFENVRGSEFTDHITGNAGNNLLDGAGGADDFFVSAGIDTILGGAGNDTLRLDHSAGATANLATGSYSVGGGGGQGTLASIEHAVGSAFADQLTGNAGTNHLSGGDGSDTLTGGGGNDQLWGGPGSDRLVADAGNDTLVGNNDILGGATDTAADIFEVRPGAGAVTITDFQPGVDQIDLSAFGFDANGNSPLWTASGSNSPTQTLLQLTHTNGTVVSITLQGLAQGQGSGLTMADFIGGSPALLPPAGPVPVPGGNGTADTFLVDPWAILANGGVLDIVGFEDGLDVIDLRPFNLNGGSYWGGWFYDYGPQNQTRLEFWGLNQEFVVVNLVGHNYAQADASDFLL